MSKCSFFFFFCKSSCIGSEAGKKKKKASCRQKLFRRYLMCAPLSWDSDALRLCIHLKRVASCAPFLESALTGSPRNSAYLASFFFFNQFARSLCLSVFFFLRFFWARMYILFLFTWCKSRSCLITIKNSTHRVTIIVFLRRCQTYTHRHKGWKQHEPYTKKKKRCETKQLCKCLGIK